MKPRYAFNILFRHAPRRSMPGDWAGTWRGTGYEFWQLREYTPGDSKAHMDWKAKARTGKLHVREYLQDTVFTLMLLCDVSPSMELGEKFLFLEDMASSLAHAALRMNNPCGLVLYDAHEPVDFVPPGTQRSRYQRILEKLRERREVRPKEAGTREGGAFSRLAAFRPGVSPLERALELCKDRTSSCIGVILSDFLDDLSTLKGFYGGGASAGFSAGHEFVALHLLEQVEYELPEIRDGTVCVRNMESGEVLELDLTRWREYNAAMERRLRKAVEGLSRAGIDSLVLKVGQENVQEEVNRFFLKRVKSGR